MLVVNINVYLVFSIVTAQVSDQLALTALRYDNTHNDNYTDLLAVYYTNLKIYKCRLL